MTGIIGAGAGRPRLDRPADSPGFAVRGGNCDAGARERFARLITQEGLHTRMPDNRGTIVLMGSGELTGTMVELHKKLLHPFGPDPKAVFLDTPAGFQLNVDQIAKKAGAYFTQRVQKNLQVASFKSARTDDESAKARAYATLSQADYILIGPGSPTYAIQHWHQSPIPQLLTAHIEKGGCLVAASAAALTTGRLTLPVYEIYKVGQPLHWVDGLDLLGHFGMNLVVFPHWNNAEGGNHDTRYCFMGEDRLQALERLIPSSTKILGLDEHTALIIDLNQQKASAHGLGRVTLRSAGKELSFGKGDDISFSVLKGETQAGAAGALETKAPEINSGQMEPENDIWKTLHGLAAKVRGALDQDRDDQAAASLLELERQVWRNRDVLEEQDELGAARELFREMVALLAARISERPVDQYACLGPLVEPLIELRSLFRQEKKYTEADALRHCLQKANIIVEDTPTGVRWVFGSKEY